MAELTGWLFNQEVISATFSTLGWHEKPVLSQARQGQRATVCVIILPVLVLVRPDIIFIENIIMDVLGHRVKHFREPGKQTAIFKQHQKKNR